MSIRSLLKTVPEPDEHVLHSSVFSAELRVFRFEIFVVVSKMLKRTFLTFNEVFGLETEKQ